jgi:hypothetical protein
VCQIGNEYTNCSKVNPGGTLDYINLNCIGGYSASFEFDIDYVYYNTPFVSGGSFGTVQSDPVNGEGGNTYFTAHVWGCLGESVRALRSSSLAIVGEARGGVEATAPQPHGRRVATRRLDEWCTGRGPLYSGSACLGSSIRHPDKSQL